jgi:hypothetical protein
MYSSIVLSFMVAKGDGGYSPMTSGGVGTPAINIGRFKTYKVRTKFDNWGRKRWENHNGSQQFSNGCAKIITSLEVVSDPTTLLQRAL